MTGERAESTWELPDGWRDVGFVPWSGVSIDMDEGTAVYVAPADTTDRSLRGIVSGLKGGTTITTTGEMPGNVYDSIVKVWNDYRASIEREREADRRVYVCPAAEYEQRRRTLACDLLGLAAEGKPRPRVSLIPSECMPSGTMIMVRRGAVTFEDPVLDELVRRYAL